MGGRSTKDVTILGLTLLSAPFGRHLAVNAPLRPLCEAADSKDARQPSRDFQFCFQFSHVPVKCPASISGSKSRRRLFLIEAKSRPGIRAGDAQWTRPTGAWIQNQHRA